jgi:poly(3-hydroxybutyrate) depolymerase
MQTAKLGLLVGFAIAALIGCSSSSAPPINQLPSGGGSNGTAGASNTTAGASNTSAGASNTSAGAGGSGNSAGQSSTAGGPAGGASPTAGAGGMSSAGASGNGAAGSGGGTQSALSDGCGKDLAGLKDQSGAAFTLAKGKWVEVASQPNPQGQGGTTPPPMMVPCDTADDRPTPGHGASYPPCANGMKKRGFWVYLPANFDNTKPSKVIYEAAGCGDTSPAQGGTSSYPYQDVDQASAIQVILVGLEYSRNDLCYDNQSPTSNDFKLFPLLHQWMEKNFCVDKTKQYFSGYSTGAWVANQFTCAFPDVLHGFVFATGSEPMQPTCVSGHPAAGLFLHDIADSANTFTSMLPGCARLLTQNGCTVKTCDTQTMANTALTTKYDVSASFVAPPSIQCVSFNGCPANAPVVWCTTNENSPPNHYLQAADPVWIKKLFWDFINKN